MKATHFPKTIDQVVISGIVPPKDQGEDLIVMTAHRIENITKDEALRQALAFNEAKGYSAFAFGGILALVHANEWYKGEHKTFAAYAKEVLGISKSRAYAYMGIYESLVKNGIPWERVEQIGWAKVSILATVLTKENCGQWVTLAKDMTVGELKEYAHAQVAAAQQAFAKTGTPSSLSEELTSTTSKVAVPPNDKLPQMSNQLDIFDDPQTKDSSPPSSTDPAPLVTEEAIAKKPIPKRFMLYADQFDLVNKTLDKAKNDFPTEYENVALEHICMSYLTGSLGKPKTSLVLEMQHAGYEQVLAKCDELWPFLNIEVEILSASNDADFSKADPDDDDAIYAEDDVGL